MRAKNTAMVTSGCQRLIRVSSVGVRMVTFHVRHGNGVSSSAHTDWYLLTRAVVHAQVGDILG